MASVRFTGTRTTTATVSASVLVKKNGDHASTGVKVQFDHDSASFDDWLVVASKQLDVFPPAQKCFDAFGQEVSDLLQFQDGTVVFLAQLKTDAFVPPQSDSGNGGGDDKGALPTMLGSFTVGKVVGKGSLGTGVATAENTATGEKVCLKFIPKASLGDMDVVHRLDAMVQSLTQLANVAGIVRFQQRQDTSTHVVLLFDHWGGETLRRFIAARSPVANRAALPEAQAAAVMAQVTDAVIHMHLKGVVHCHISPDSVVLAQPGNLDSVLIGNFDSAQVRAPGERFKPSLGHGSSSDVNHLPPEAFLSEPVDGPSLDCWGLGVLYFCLVCGRYPFFGRNLAEGVPVPLKPLMFNIKTRSFALDKELAVATRFAVDTMLTLDPTDRPDAPLVKRLVLGEVPVPARYDAPAPGDGLSRSQHGSGAAGVGFTAPGMPSRASFSALGGSAHGTEDDEKERRVSMFPSVGGGGSGKSDKGGKSGGGGITGLLAGIFSSSKSAKDDKAADGGGGGGGGGALDGLSKRLVNSTRIKVDEQMQKLSQMVASSLDRAKDAKREARQVARSDGRPTSGNNSENNSRPTSKDARHRRDRQETPFPNESSSHSGELLSGVDDDERSMRRPKPVFRARALSGPVVALDVPLPDGGTEHGAPTAAAQDSSPGPTGLDLSASVAAAVAAVSHGAADDPYNSARGTAAGPDGGNDGGEDEEEYSTSFGFGGKRAPSKRPSVKAVKAK